MKKLVKILAVIMSVVMLSSFITVNAESVEPNLDLAEGKIAYYTSSGLAVQATKSEYDPRDTGITPYYGFSVALSVDGQFKIAVSNEEDIEQKFSLKLITDSGIFQTEKFSVITGSNLITVDTADIQDFSGNIQEIKFILDAFYYLNCILVFEGILDAQDNTLWSPTKDNWTKDTNPAVTFSIKFCSANTLVGSGLSKSKWYAVTFNTGKTDLSVYEGFSFEVDTTIDGKDVYFNKYLQEYTGSDLTEKWYAPDIAVFYCYKEGGTSFKMTGNSIPAYFKGTIVIPFNTFEIPDWNKQEFSGNEVMDLNNTDGTIGFTFDGSLGDFLIGLKNFRLVEQVEDIETVIETQGDMKYIDNMSSYDSSETANFAWRTNWSLASPCTVELLANPNQCTGATGNALKITPQDAPKNPEPDPNTGIATATGYTALELFPTGGAFDISGTSGITFFIKNLQNSPFYINCEFDILQDGWRQRWQVKQYGRYILYDTETGTQKIFNAFNGIYIPADFCGFVRIGYSQLRNPSWETVGGDFTNETGLVYFVINVDTNLFSGYSFIFDSLGVYSEQVQLKTLFNTPNKDIVSAIGGNE